MEEDEYRRERRSHFRREDDARYATLERLLMQHDTWLRQMGVPEASERERGSWIHLARWWVRGEDTRRERRRFVATVVAASTIVGPILSAVVAEIVNHLHL